MPWGGNGWRPDEVEKPYVLQAKINRAKMQTEIDAGFYTEANLEELFVALTNNFYENHLFLSLFDMCIWSFDYNYSSKSLSNC